MNFRGFKGQYRPLIVCICLTLSCQLLVAAEPYKAEGAPIEDITSTPDFIAPNEFEFYRSNTHLNGHEGVLISVGTFRALHDSSIGNFAEVYLLDYNKMVCEFNQQHLLLIAESTDRIDYLRRLFDNPNVAEQIQLFQNGLLTEESLRAQLILYARQIEERSTHKAFQLTDGYLYTMIEFILDKKSFTNSFLGNTQYFNKLKKLVVQRKIFVLPGSLNGKKVLTWLAKVLMKKNLNVSVIDISNSEDYITREKRQFLRNLEQLPFAENGVVLTTVDGFRPHEKSQRRWGYLSTPIAKYLPYKYFSMFGEFPVGPNNNQCRKAL